MSKVVWVSSKDDLRVVDKIRSILPDVKIISGRRVLDDTKPDALVFTYTASEKDVRRVVSKFDDVPAAVEVSAEYVNVSRWGHLGTDLTISEHFGSSMDTVLPELLRMEKSSPLVTKMRREMRGRSIVPDGIDKRTKEACYSFKENSYAAWVEHVFSDNEFINKIRQVVEGRPVVELGPGTMGGLPWELLHLGAISYVGVDPFNCPDKREVVEGRNNMLHPIPPQLHDKIEYKRVSGLSYLEGIPDGKNVVTVSSAVLANDIIRKEHRDYAVDLARQIIRVGFRGPTAIHTVDPWFEQIFAEEGFKIAGTKNLTGTEKLHIYSKE